MATTLIQTGVDISRPEVRSGSLNGFQRYVVRRSHPASIFIEVAGLIWAFFYLWDRLWVEALMVAIFTRLVANVAVYRVSAEALSQTTLGKIALLHLHPVNILTQSVGLVGTLYGVWVHDTRAILAGISVILLGHLSGWSQVDKRFKIN